MYKHYKKDFFIKYINEKTKYIIVDHIGYNKKSLVFTCKIKNTFNLLVLKIIKIYDDDSYDELIILKNNKSNNLLKLIDHFCFDVLINDINDKYIVVITKKLKYDLTHFKLINYDHNIKINLCIDIIDGLKNLYDRGYYHGDIKPENIGVKKIKINDKIIIPKLCLIDFGLTKIFYDNDKDITNTYPYISLYQLHNQILFGHIKLFTSFHVIKLREILLKSDFKFFYIDDKMYFCEDKINNQLYTFGLLCCYILSNNLCLFDYNNTKNNSIIFNNIIDFYTNKKSYLKKFFKKIKKLNNFGNKFYQWKKILYKIFYYKIEFHNLSNYITQYLFIYPKNNKIIISKKISSN